GANEMKAMLKHPGPTLEFAKWCKQMEFKYLAVDCGSADHPMNTKIRDWCPVQAAECEKYLQKKYGKGINDFFPPEDYQLMHIELFPHDIIHIENIGGDVDKVLGKRLIIGCYPWRFEGGESSICRVVAYDEED
ncbi:MAG: cyclase family protein, partial [Negativicutes bacterium]|nr:cyclase family protein [Negativicutes bacterium]